MQKNSDHFSTEKAMELANSPAGMQLLDFIRNSDSDALKQAMSSASGGDLGAAKQALAPLLASKEVQALLKQLGGTNG